MIQGWDIKTYKKREKKKTKQKVSKQSVEKENVEIAEERKKKKKHFEWRWDLQWLRQNNERQI